MPVLLKGIVAAGRLAWGTGYRLESYGAAWACFGCCVRPKISVGRAGGRRYCFATRRPHEAVASGTRPRDQRQCFGFGADRRSHLQRSRSWIRHCAEAGRDDRSGAPPGFRTKMTTQDRRFLESLHPGGRAVARRRAGAVETGNDGARHQIPEVAQNILR